MPSLSLSPADMYSAAVAYHADSLIKEEEEEEDEVVYGHLNGTGGGVGRLVERVQAHDTLIVRGMAPSRIDASRALRLGLPQDKSARAMVAGYAADYLSSPVEGAAVAAATTA